jgi:LmbE family N-acetylglucosaminyl deacetylase
VKRYLQSRLEAGLREPDREFDRATAMVIAPHPDDETLGCGGLIARKARAGVQVTIVVLTDGGSSHTRWMERSRLVATRREELVRAVGELGVSCGDVRFLDVPDQTLAGHEEESAVQLAEIIRTRRPQQVFAPHPSEPPSDHAAAWRIACRATQLASPDVTVYAYAVWLWGAWPWVPGNWGSPRKARSTVRQALTTNRALMSFDLGIKLDGDVHLKRKALSAHATQMTRPEGQQAWPVLGDVGDGEFLEQVLGEFEPFLECGPAGAMRSAIAVKEAGDTRG